MIISFLPQEVIKTALTEYAIFVRAKKKIHKISSHLYPFMLTAMWRYKSQSGSCEVSMRIMQASREIEPACNSV